MRKLVCQCDACDKIEEIREHEDVPRGWIVVTANRLLGHYCDADCMKVGTISMAEKVKGYNPSFSESLDRAAKNLGRLFP